LKEGQPSGAIDTGFFYPVVINPGCTGGNCYRDAWENSINTDVGPGSTLNPEPGSMIGPTKQAVQALIDQDLNAFWDTTTNGGRGGPVNGCMQAGTCIRSPRWVAIPLFDVQQYDYDRAFEVGRGRTVIVKVIGFWLDQIQGNDVYGRILS